MEYMEIPTLPKAVMDNLLAGMVSPASSKEPAPPVRHNNGYRPMPAPLFHGTTIQAPASSAPPKAPGASLPPLSGGVHRKESSVSPLGTLLKDFPGTGGPVGLTALPPSLVKEKPKRVRKSRAGTTPKKRGISDSALDANPDGDQQPPQLPPPKRRRPSAKLLGDGENAEKPPPRKRNRSKGKGKDEHALSASTTDTLFSHLDPTSSKGILGAYGLETKALDLTRYMKDISLESLMAGDFNAPSLPHKQGPPPGSMVDNSFGLQVSSILQNLTRSSNTEQVRLAPLFSKMTESKPQKFSLDLESMPLDESEESLGGGMLDTKIKAPCYEASLLQGRKTQDASSLFSLETIPVVPPVDFWNTLQIHPTVSLNSLIAQASATSDSRFFPTDMGSSCDKATILPPSIFSLGSTQLPQESACDRVANFKLNHWFRAETPKQEASEALPGHVVSTSLGSVFPFKLDAESDTPTKPMEKCAQKEGFFDFDLNEQSPEAEEAESIAHSASTRSLSVNEIPVVVQALIDTDGTNGGLQSIAHVNVSEHAKEAEAEATCNIESAMDGQVVGDACASSPQKNETTGRQSEDDSLMFVNKKHSFGEFKDMSTNASRSLPTLLVPDGPETEEMYSDVPYSPGMQATARLLCRMASSSSPFYVDKQYEHLQVTASCNDAFVEWPTKSAKVVGPVEKDVRVHRYPALHQGRDEEHASKAQARDAKEKSLYSQMVSSCTHVDKAEPWASTPPRHAPKNVASHMSGSQSSESDKSPCLGPREHIPNGNHRNTNKMKRDRQEGGAEAVKRASSSFPKKDLKGNHTPVSKTSLLHALPTKGGASVSAGQKRSLEACETKQHTEGLTKLSRPRSNTSKNCLQLQRSSANGFPVQPRSLNGCAIKSPGSRHVWPYVGEVRHGSK